MIKFSEDRLSVAEYLELREAVGWKKLSERQAELALENCLYCISAYDEGKLIGMGRNVLSQLSKSLPLKPYVQKHICF